jgi:hypothetical protein
MMTFQNYFMQKNAFTQHHQSFKLKTLQVSCHLGKKSVSDTIFMSGKPSIYGTSDLTPIFSTHAAMLTLKLKCLKIISRCMAKIQKIKVMRAKIKKGLHLDLRSNEKPKIEEKALMKNMDSMIKAPSQLQGAFFL